MPRIPAGPILVGLAVAAAIGCTHPQPLPQTPPLTVRVSQPVQRDVTNYEIYTGRTAAVESVDVRAQVTGFLDKINFSEGAEVDQNAVLYKIDPRSYQAILNQAEANLHQAQVHRESQADIVQRDLATPSATPQATLIQDQANLGEAEAAIGAARASRDAAQLNVSFTSVTSPIAGQVGRTLITRGNLVVANQTLLTTVVSLDPIYTYFDVDETTVENIRQMIREGKLPAAREKGQKIPVSVGLASEKGYPHEGAVDFINNQVSASTATLQVRGVFANPKPAVGPRLLSPGQFVRVRLSVGPPYSALLVLGAAVGNDQNLSYVYVVNDQNQVERRDVTLGSDQGGMSVIAEGLNPDDRVIISGLQHVRPGMTVAPKSETMPDPASDVVPPTPPSDAAAPQMKQ